MIYRSARACTRRGDNVLRYRDSFDILMEIRLSGVAKRLLWKCQMTMPSCHLVTRLVTVEIVEDVSVSDAGKLIRQLISN